MPFQHRAAQRAVSDPFRSPEKTQWEAETVTVQFLREGANGVGEYSFVSLRQVNTSACVDPPVTCAEDTSS